MNPPETNVADALTTEMLNDSLRSIHDDAMKPPAGWWDSVMSSDLGGEGTGDRRRRLAARTPAPENLSVEDMLKKRGIQLICFINGELKEPLNNRAEVRSIEAQLLGIARRQIRMHLNNIRAKVAA